MEISQKLRNLHPLPSLYLANPLIPPLPKFRGSNTGTRTILQHHVNTPGFVLVNNLFHSYNVGVLQLGMYFVLLHNCIPLHRFPLILGKNVIHLNHLDGNRLVGLHILGFIYCSERPRTQFIEYSILIDLFPPKIIHGNIQLFSYGNIDR